MLFINLVKFIKCYKGYKVIYKSCSFAGSLDEGETAETIYKDMIGD